MLDIDIIYNIFENRSYDNPYLLEQEILNIPDSKLITGLLVDLIGKSDEYGFDGSSIVYLLNDYEEDSTDAHQYYIDILKNDEKADIRKFKLDKINGVKNRG